MTNGDHVNKKQTTPPDNTQEPANQTPSENWSPRLVLIYPILAIVALILVHHLFWNKGGDPLVVYCAHDSVYSEKILKKFERETGIKVVPKFDTEATKSLGLIELLVREKDNPRCDVFWNNEVLGTIDLKDKGVLTPYQGPGHQRIPAAFKDPDGFWTGFGARLRVFIVNTDAMAATEDAVQEKLKGDLSKFAFAKPLYGTTLTHYCCLWRELGGDGLKAFHEDRLKRGAKMLGGNADVKNAVVAGAMDFGWTDTDDFFVGKDAGKPVDMVPVRLKDGATICIPNTVAVIKGTKNLEKAKKLVDYLLSEKCELALANAKSRQIPLGPVDEAKLPDDVKKLNSWAKDGAPLYDLSDIRTKCVAWLKSIL